MNNSTMSPIALAIATLCEDHQPTASEFYAGIGGAVKANEEATASVFELACIGYAAGVRLVDWATKSEHKQERVILNIRNSVISGFSNEEKMLLAPKNTNGMSDAAKVLRREAQQKIGRYKNWLARELANIETDMLCEEGYKVDWKTGAIVAIEPETSEPGETETETETGETGETVLAALKLPEKPNHAQLSAMAAYVLAHVREAEPEFFNGHKVNVTGGVKNYVAGSKALGFDVE